MKRLILVLCLVAFSSCPAHSADPESLPFDPNRSSLYTNDDLWKNYTVVDDPSVDGYIYKYFQDSRKYAPSLSELQAQRKHDAGIEYALNQWLGIDKDGAPSKRVVMIMGSHSTSRDDPLYARVARLAYALANAKPSYVVVTGGGPGLMEAGTLGAYMANYTPDDLEKALAILATSKKPDPGANQYDMPDYWPLALQITKQFPNGAENLGIPTWFYGHEGANAFSTLLSLA